MLPLADLAARSERVLAEVERAVVGKRDALEVVLLGFLADGHVLIEDFPGLAKTLIARSFAQVFDMDFARIQFTPDLMPSDVTGSSVFDQRTGDFAFRAGPIFTKESEDFSHGLNERTPIADIAPSITYLTVLFSDLSK